VQVGYAYRRFEDKGGGSYVQAGTKSGVTYSSAVIHSPQYSALAGWGVPFEFGKHFFVDCFIGAGAKVVVTKYDAENEQAVQFLEKRTCDPWGNAAVEYNGTLLRFHGAVGFRLGWKL
jgi:hypothetical protein